MERFDLAEELIRGAKLWIDPIGHRLSNRIWLGRQRDRRAIDLVLMRAYLSGERSEDAVAGSLQRYLRVPMRNEPDDTGAHYSARRLARTEMNRMHGVSVKVAVERHPVPDDRKGATWNRGSAHKDEDQCDEYANGSSEGFPSGTYRLDAVPDHPAHPFCACFLSPYIAPVRGGA